MSVQTKVLWGIIAAILVAPTVSADELTGRPSAPRDFMAIASEDLSIVALTWAPPLIVGDGEILGYNVYRDGDLIAEVGGLGYQDEFVSIEALYSVAAVNSIGEGLPSLPTGVLFSGGCTEISLQHVPPHVGVDLGCTFVFFNLACGLPNDPPRTQICLVRKTWVDVVQNTTGPEHSVPVIIDLTHRIPGHLYGTVYGELQPLRPI